MAKRRKSRARKAGAHTQLGISKKQYENLIKEATNTRKRIRAFSQRNDADLYNIPDVSLYTMGQIAFRIKSGESPKNVMSEMAGITAKNIVSGAVDLGKSDFGYQMTQQQSTDLRRAVNEANRAIRQAKEANPLLADVYPAEFSYKDLSSTIVSEGHFKNLVEDLRLYNEAGLQIMGMPGTGEAVTIAEYARNRRILDEENERRKLKRLADEEIVKNIAKQGGYLRSQKRYDEEPLDYTQYSRELMNKRAQTWDDPARTYRANLFLNNYMKSLELFRDIIIIQGLSTKVFVKQANEILDIIDSLYNNEDAIDYISRYMPNINISIISDRVVFGDGFGDSYDSFKEIYEDWQTVAREWL